MRRPEDLLRWRGMVDVSLATSSIGEELMMSASIRYSLLDDANSKANVGPAGRTALPITSGYSHLGCMTSGRHLLLKPRFRPLGAISAKSGPQVRRHGGWPSGQVSHCTGFLSSALSLFAIHRSLSFFPSTIHLIISRCPEVCPYFILWVSVRSFLFSKFQSNEVQ